MKKINLQVALDRIDLEKGISLLKKGSKHIDIIEIGTSLIKWNGLNYCMERFRSEFPNQQLLVDMKTCDDAKYECTKVFELGADITTVMGNASCATIDICQSLAKAYQKQYMIDLLEVSKERLLTLKDYEDAIFCIHLSKDKEISIDCDYISELVGVLGTNRRLAVAGGIQLQTLETLKAIPQINTIIVGSAITQATCVEKEILLYQAKIKEEQ